ncbi:hypothetical protein ABZ901_13665, partial [Actinacidiphila alni]
MASDPHSPHDDDRTSADPGDEPRHTLLSTAATGRPLPEVASLVSLLRQTGDAPSAGDEALRLAAVARPVDEVRQLVTLLGEPPHANGEAGTALRAAAMGRPIEDVAELVTIFSTRAPGEEAADTAAGGGGGPGGPGRTAEPAPPRTEGEDRTRDAGAPTDPAVRPLSGRGGARTGQASLR